MAGILVFAAASLVVLTVAIARHYVSALRDAAELEKTTQFPVVRTYMPSGGLVWHVVEPQLAPWIDRLPFAWRHWFDYYRVLASWIHKGRLPREELGSDVYWVVGPSGRILRVQDPELIYDITHRWKDFPKNVRFYKSMEIFGGNVLTLEGSQWAYHRRHISSSFVEPTMDLVVSEAQRLMTGLIDALQGVQIPPSSFTSRLTLYLTAGSGFGQYMDWSGVTFESSGSKAQRDEVTKATSFAPVLFTFVEHLYPLLILPTWLMKKLPSPTLNAVGHGKEKFESMVRETVSRIRATASTEDTGPHKLRKHDLLSNLVNAPPSVSGGHFSDQDIVGNVFILTAAAQDSTSSTLQTALILLAIHTDIQEDLQAEVDAICVGKAADEAMTYKADWPKMRNIMAFMLEVLRCHPTFASLPKITATVQHATYKGQPFQVPANTEILYDIVGAQYDPRIWGPDASSFRPSRWLMPEGYEAPPKTINHCKDQPNMLCPPRGAFLAFSEGPRNCVGKKFAEVGVCTLLATLLRTHSVELAPLGDGGDESERNWRRTRDEAARKVEEKKFTVSLKMKNDVMVRFVKRGNETFPPRTYMGKA